MKCSLEKPTFLLPPSPPPPPPSPCKRRKRDREKRGNIGRLGDIAPKERERKYSGPQIHTLYTVHTHKNFASLTNVIYACKQFLLKDSHCCTLYFCTSP